MGYGDEGYGDYAALSAELDRHRNCVTRHCGDIFAASPDGEHALAHLWQDNADAEKSVATLSTLGFRQPREIESRLRAMRSGSRYREMPAASVARFDRLVPLTVAAAAAQK